MLPSPVIICSFCHPFRLNYILGYHTTYVSTPQALQLRDETMAILRMAVEHWPMFWGWTLTSVLRLKIDLKTVRYLLHIPAIQFLKVPKETMALWKNDGIKWSQIRSHLRRKTKSTMWCLHQTSKTTSFKIYARSFFPLISHKNIVHLNTISGSDSFKISLSECFELKSFC